MKICLLTLGTRGDVQPFAVLGKAFQERGHDVLLSTGKNFSPLAESYGLRFVPVEADFQALITSDAGRAMMKNPFLARKYFTSIVQPMMVDAMKAFYHLAKEADCVLFHVKALGDYFADQFPEKMVRTNVVPAFQITREFPNPVFSAMHLPQIFNRLTYKLTDLGLTMVKGAIRAFRASEGLEPAPSKGVNLPSIYGVSESVLPKPKDYPADSFFTGFWHGQSSQHLDASLSDFLNNGRKSVLMTFGSMPFETTFNLTDSVIATSQELDINFVIVKGWGFNNTEAFQNIETVRVIDHAPYDKVLPHVHAAVHHGGIGTIAECLRAATPFLSCPVIYPMGDQYFWGAQANKIGCSPRPIPLKKLTHFSLRSSIVDLLSNENFATKLKAVSQQLQTENGVQNAVRIIESKFCLTIPLDKGNSR